MHSGSKRIGRIESIKIIAIWISILSGLGLFLIFLTVPNHSLNYAEQVRALQVSQHNLPRLMLTVGLLLALGTGITTWMIAVYSSFRLAGPLFRLSQNLKAAIATSEVDHIPLRQADLLQEEARQLQDVSRQQILKYQHLHQAALSAQQALEAGDDAAFAAAMNTLNGTQGGDSHEPTPVKR